ncbi:MAG: hypothetical protein ACYSU0_23205 [Planctomycetota bacterium]|jgi:hypothetical protein
MVQLISRESIEKAKALSADWEKRRKQRRAALDESSGYNAWGKKIEKLKAKRKLAKSDAERAGLDAEIKRESADRHKLWWKNRRAMGSNPYVALARGDRIQKDQQNLVYHTTADWDGRTREEIEGKVTPEMKEWLARVRGH